MDATTLPYLSEPELEKTFRKCGSNVRISRLCRIYGGSDMEIGDNVRIDDFAVLSGAMRLGNRIHIAVACCLFGGSDAPITMDDFSGLSSRVSVYAKSDDYSGESLTNPMVPAEFKAVEAVPVVIGRHAIVGAGSVLLPGTHLAEGTAIGALSLVKGHTEPFTIYAGNPLRKLKPRSRHLLQLEQRLTR